MFLDLPHTNLDAYQCSGKLVLECYKVSKMIPDIERFGLVQQIRRAATSATLNIAEGCSRKSPDERRRYFEIARGSIVEIDSILDLLLALEYCSRIELQPTGELVVRNFKMLSVMISKTRA